MLKMMANENLAEYDSDGWAEIETVRVTIAELEHEGAKVPVWSVGVTQMLTRPAR
jgi:hypothetical protein